MTAIRNYPLAVFVLAMIPLADSATSTATTSFQVTATVTASCSVAATDVAFGSYNPFSGTDGTATGTITATCTNGTPYSIDLSAGSSGSFATRTMSDGSSGTLNYNLYSTSGGSSILGDGTSSTVLITGAGATGTGSGQAYSVYGTLPTGQNTAPVGSYTDSITVTLNY